MSNQTSQEVSPELNRRNGVKIERDECLDVAPPALPPRPHSHSHSQNRSGAGRNDCNCDFNPDQQRNTWTSRSCWSSGLRKYVFLCTLCGTLCVILGALFLAVYFMLKSYTSSLNYFETIPTYIPAAMLMTTGFLISCLACRKNRNSFLMKLCGACSLLCALLCLSVTVTTAVIHMNRLQTLRECYYTGKTRSCTCESIIAEDDISSDDTVKFVFNSTSDCEVIHGVLYSCLRAVFGLSVVGILICIFTCMLVYQLLSHEKKKMYWAQLEMRCRYLYGQQGQQQYCSCCDECRYPAPTSHEMFPWELMGNRYFTPGRIGNLYTPNPEDRNEQARPGWSWRRLPWGRNSTAPPSNTHGVRMDVSSPDSQYGFTSGANGETPVEGAPYTVIDSRTQAMHSECTAGMQDVLTEGGFYSWGPPPPYSSNPNSTNNSPARRTITGLLNQVSPRRNNISPARLPRNRLIRPPVRFDRATNIQPKAMPLRPAGPLRPLTVTNAMQRQIATTSSNRSVSMTSVSHSDGDPKPDNYENASEIERIYQNRKMNNSSVTGFNTLPSLKKRNQTDLNEVFEKQPSSSFTSVENIKLDTKPEENLRYECSNNDTCSVGSHSLNTRYEKEDKHSDIYQNGQYAKKKVARKLEYPAGVDQIRSRQNEKPQLSKNAIRRPIAKPPRNTPATPENKTEKLQKTGQNDPDLIKKHGSLMKELNMGRRNRNLGENDVGFENYGFQHLEKDQHVSKTNICKPDNDIEIAIIGYNPNKKLASRCDRECESDVYFGDISNSSCYMSIRSEVPEPLYEETVEPKKDQGQPFLNKTNLELIEKENNKLDVKNLEYSDCLTNPSPSSLASTASRSSSGCKRLRDSSDHSIESYCTNRSGTFPGFSAEDRESGSSSVKNNTVFTKHVRHYEPDIIRRDVPLHHQLPNQFRPVRETSHPINSNDEQSSSSLTADSGISSARNYIPRGYYCDKIPNENLSADSESSSDHIKTSSVDGFVPLTEFTAAILQKPKIHPRGGRNRDQDSLEFDNKIRTPQCYVKKGKKHYIPGTTTPEGEQQPPNPKPRSTNAKTPGSSPKPLPRTTIPKLKYSEGNNGLDISHKSFLAPDAQYDFKESSIKSNRAKMSRVVHGSPRCKPSVPARPLHLPPKPCEKLFQSLATSQRRRPTEDDCDLATECQPTTSRSVNV